MLAKLLDRGFEFQADIGELDVVRLGAKRIGFPVELLREKIEAAADRSALPHEQPSLRHVRGQAVKLLTDIGLGRDQDRFLMQPVRIEALGLR